MRLRERLYADTTVNNGRQKELDLAKSAVILCLAIVHCIIECTPEEMLVSGIPYLFDSVIGGPLGAPIFMFAMGVGFAYQKNQSFRSEVLRGVQFVVIGYLLNIARYLIPYLIGYAITKDAEQYTVALLYKVLCNDVMLFAGLAILLLAIFKKWGVKDWQMVIFAFAASAVGTVLTGIDVNSPLGNIFLGYLIGTEDAAGLVMSYFPALNWFVFPVGGYIFGKRLLCLKNKNLFYGILTAVCVPASVIYYAMGITMERGMFGEGQNCYYHLQFSDACGATLSTLALLGIYHFLAKILPGWLHRGAEKVSRNINSIYCIHWVFVVLITNVGLYIWRGTQILPVGWTVLIGVMIEIIAIFIADVWQKIKRRMRETAR